MVKIVQKPASIQQITAAAAVITALFSILLLMVSPQKLSFNVWYEIACYNTQVVAVLSVETYARILSATLIVQLVSWRIAEPVLVGLKFWYSLSVPDYYNRNVCIHECIQITGRAMTSVEHKIDYIVCLNTRYTDHFVHVIMLWVTLTDETLRQSNKLIDTHSIIHLQGLIRRKNIIVLYI